jgi:hypothetical protein
MADVPSSDTVACRACRQPIVFAQTNKIEAGRPKMMPVNIDPHPDGNVILQRQGDVWHAGVIGHRAQLAGMRANGVQLHQSHMMTCPDRDRFIREKRRGR